MKTQFTPAIHPFKRLVCVSKRIVSNVITCLALSIFAANTCAAGSFSMQIQNKCDAPVAYKLESRGSSLQSSLGSRSSATLSVDEGDKIIVNGTTLTTVSAASKGSATVLCTK
jgi:hypothetical protein